MMEKGKEKQIKKIFQNMTIYVILAINSKINANINNKFWQTFDIHVGNFGPNSKRIWKKLAARY